MAHGDNVNDAAAAACGSAQALADSPLSAAGAALAAVVAAHALERPRDGDCEETAEAVTHALQAQGFPARTAILFAWADPSMLPFPVSDDARIIAFAHVVTELDGWIGDCTARQYDPALPAAWVAPQSDYLAKLAAVTGTASVTVVNTCA